jgi:hypothetical protein
MKEKYRVAVEAYKNAHCEMIRDEETRYNYALAKKMLKTIRQKIKTRKTRTRKTRIKKDDKKDGKKDKNKDKKEWRQR